jgi:DNA-binding CsgD family transcriptional regulator
LARVETMRGRADAALERLLESEARGIAAGAAMALPLTRLGQARAYAALGRLEQAETLLRAVIADTPQARWEECEALLVLGNVRRILGAPSGSLACAREALELSERLGMRSLSADGQELLAMLAIGRGEWSEADGLAHDALARRVEIGAPIWLPQTLDLMALVAAGLESYAEAARLLGAAERARSDLGVVRWPPDEPAFEELERTIVGQLGTEEYAAARGQGAAVALDDAVGWARRARGTRKRPSGGWESLTPTELQVVQLVTKGLTNPQVAERMFISRATVKAHLSHIFQKLGLTSRSELAAVAARRAE